MSADDKMKNKALELAVEHIHKAFGDGSIMRLGDSTEVRKVPAISTGSLSLDAALGIGGIPRGRVSEIFGPEASGKTTLSLHVIAEAQKAGGLAAFIDAEHAMDPNYAEALGVDIENLWVAQPDNGEQALEICETLVRSGAIDIVVIDSVAALVPKAEIEGDMGDRQVGAQARLMSQALRKLTGAINKSKTAVLFVNQTRMKIGVMFGNPETTSGGVALKFYSTIRINIRKGATIKLKDDPVGSKTYVQVVKNKLAPPFKKTEFDIIYGKGISLMGEIIDMGVDLKIVGKKGTWYNYGDIKLGQGRENARDFLDENRDIADEIMIKIKKEIGLLPPDEEAPDDKSKKEE
ncbi:MAG TPA: recombinase RecA [candidate division Zixibacteria bacterium]|nr:recombinase RecA [candidate division Zixibacteria bacterium]